MRSFERQLEGRRGIQAHPMLRKNIVIIIIGHLTSKVCLGSFVLDEISGEIFDLLLSLSDFTEFKDLMLSYKKSKLDRRSTSSLTVSQTAL